jgi:S1-C subfamily serine protease
MLGREAAAAVAYLPPRAPAAVVDEDAALAASAFDESLARPPPASSANPAARKTASKRRSKPVRTGVFISAANVLRLAQGAAMPRAVAVGPHGARPAGLRLIGVGALGIGMRDGDVLTRVLGAPVGSAGEVISRVISARARRAREISGEFWRDGAPCSLVVEQPYLEEKPEPPRAP